MITYLTKFEPKSAVCTGLKIDWHEVPKNNSSVSENTFLARTHNTLLCDRRERPKDIVCMCVCEIEEERVVEYLFSLSNHSHNYIVSSVYLLINAHVPKMARDNFIKFNRKYTFYFRTKSYCAKMLLILICNNF